MGDISANVSRDDVKTAAQGAGAHEIINRLPQQYDTLLGKLFAGGADLSVGEWQRVALARAFMRKAQVIILDEPTSFMDPWAEADWMERFHTLVQGRTAIIITHRFTTARHADKIFVMKAGKIAEAGSHEELLAQRGLYAKSWSIQTQGGYAEPEENFSELLDIPHLPVYEQQNMQ
jgi:ATP-binding cassette subfamily B protein